MSDQKQLVSVKTGEPYQPVRIYYRLFKKNTVLSALKKLKCMEYESQSDRWNWLFEAEAKKLRFDRPYSTLKPTDKPLILGYFTFRGEDQMLLDVRSSERAMQALDFFDKRINRYAANPTHLRIVNRMFSVDDMPNQQIHPSLDPFFDRDDVPCLAKEMSQAMEQLSQDYGDDEAGKEAAMQAYLDQQIDRPHPEIEEIIIYPDKMERLSLPMVLQMRQVEAFEHWRGNFTFRASQLIQQWVGSMADEIEEEESDQLEEFAESVESEALLSEAVEVIPEEGGTVQMSPQISSAAPQTVPPPVPD